LGSATSVTYQGDTTGLPNWIESARLEWRNDPDDTLAFTAPTAGMYAFTLTESTTTNQGMGVSIREASGAFYSACPDAGTVLTTDGYFESPMYPTFLDGGQRIVFWVSAAYWAMPVRQGPYTLQITRQ
jgi:hypothetical protein